MYGAICNGPPVVIKISLLLGMELEHITKASKLHISSHVYVYETFTQDVTFTEVGVEGGYHRYNCIMEEFCAYPSHYTRGGRTRGYSKIRCPTPY